jgi:Glycoside hydrolase 123, catalytic domain
MTFRAALTAIAALAFAPAAGAGVLAYPSSQTIPAAGGLPQGEATFVTLNAARGEREGAWIVASGARSVSASIDGYGLGPLQAALYFGHFVSSGGRTRADALLPWDGKAQATEKPNQPIYLQVVVPADAKPGDYRATIRVTTDGRTTEVPVSITVFPVRLPAPGDARGNLLAAFHVIPQSYVKKAQELYNFRSNGQRAAANDSLFQFLSYYRISPAGWGFGEPRTQSGYTSSNRWWLDAAGNMVRQNQDGFAAMRIPISNQRTNAASRIAGLSPFAPESWCAYLQSVRSFWDQHGWLSGHVPYLYALDEPGIAGMGLVARQASTAHSCFPGSQVLVTGNPTSSNRFLWDNKDGDDVDIWAVLSRRYYGQYNAPRQKLAAIQKVRRAGKTVWSTTYQGVPGTPGYTLTEPLSDPRMFLLWNALEGIRGTLYAQGTTSYYTGDPFDSLHDNGEYVLIYPGEREPIASARLEQIRDGIEDWDILDIVRRKHGITAVRRILGDSGLFSTTASGTILACTQGCELDGSTQYSWPQWSHDAATPAQIEAAHLQALKLASR